VILPGVGALIVALTLIAFLHKIKLQSDLFEQCLLTFCLIASVPFAACLQLLMWELRPGTETWRWSAAGISYFAGTAVMLVISIFNSESPWDRSWSARRFMISVVLMMTTLGASFLHQETYDFFRAVPGAVSKFLVGETTGS
jgi:hypothetical protein